MANPHNQTCPVAAFLNIFGDSWSLMIIREAFYGANRFSEIQRNTGIAKNLLSDRLSTMVSEGLLCREDVGERGARYAYQLTEKGRSLLPVFVAMTQWGNEHIFGRGNEPLHLVERESGDEIANLQPLTATGRRLNWSDISVKPGPGANSAAIRRISQSDRGASGAYSDLAGNQNTV